MQRGLYIHVPFCLSKCPYCDFYSIKYDKETADNYTEAVIRNIRHYGGEFDTVYFGGGTPFLLWDKICKILSFVDTAKDAEITVEANPCTVDAQKLAALHSAGVNRISFGVQSLCDDELKALGRRHNADTAVKAIKTAKEQGFDNISADIMLGTPGQTQDSAAHTVQQLAELSVTHISAYMLKIEENTPFAKMTLNLPDEDEMCSLYLKTTELLNDLGFEQYEISNYSKKGFTCRHNLKYWNCEEYLGIGPAAHSYYKGERFFVERDLNAFISEEYQKNIIDDSNPGRYEEYAMLRLRLTEGLSLSEYAIRGGDIDTITSTLKAIPCEYFSFDGDRISLTPEGFLVSNMIIGRLLGY